MAKLLAEVKAYNLLEKRQKQAKQLVLKWDVLAPESPASCIELQESWPKFNCELVGSFIFLHGGYPIVQYSPEFVHVLDLKKCAWSVLLLEGDGEWLTTVIGHSLTLVDDTLLCIGPEGSVSVEFPMDHVYCMDVVQKEWRRRDVYGDMFLPERYHAAVYWEEKRSVLINSSFMSNRHSTTYMLHKDTWEVRVLVCKGEPPSARLHHGACFVNSVEKMFIAGGQRKLRDERRFESDVFILDLSSLKTPTWSMLAPIRMLRAGFRKCSVIVCESTVLIVGGTRADNRRVDVVAAYTVNGESIGTGVRSTGASPNASNYRNHKLVQPNSNSFYLIANEPSVDGSRCFLAKFKKVKTPARKTKPRRNFRG